LDQDETSLLVFGKGDGGGGPTWEHIEKLRRCRGISDKTGLLPRVELGGSVDEFFAQLEKKAENGTNFVTWYGELYFELHRGTYTTQANNKRNNRTSEFLLRDIEYLATLASLKSTIDGKESNYSYPKKAIDFMWEGILLCQFHDCLPGSSIEMCYDDSDALYAEIFKTGEKVMLEALHELGFDDDSKSGEPVVLNTLPWDRTEMVELPIKADKPQFAIASSGMGVGDVTPLRVASDKPASIKEIKKGVYELSNSRFDVKIDNGVITSLFDKLAKREVLTKGGKAGQLVIFDDKPLYWQAWDVEVFHLDSRQELTASSSRITEQGPHRVSVETETKISEESWIKTTISLSAVADDSTASVDFAAEVEWRENMKFLKVEFPVDVWNTEASYETQFGIVRRPTHYNTSWDMAKFEVCCHKFADLSEAGYGVSILNDSKYGFATVGNLMRLSLLRAPKAPDAHADMGIYQSFLAHRANEKTNSMLAGRHHIRFAILPHIGPLDHRTIRAGYSFNNPMKIHSHPSPSSISPLLSTFKLEGNPAIIFDTLKRGENDEDVWYDGSYSGIPKEKGRSVIIRVFDGLGGKARATLTWGDVPVKKVEKVGVLEDSTGDELEILGSGKGVEIELRAFEVATYRLFL
jgi:alpha-mannosidase